MTDTPTGDSPDDALTVREAAEVLGYVTDYTRTLITSGQLPGVFDKSRRVYLIRRGDVEAYRKYRVQADPSPMFVELGRLATDINQAQERVEQLVAKRNRALVRYVDQDGQSVTAAAEAARLGRQRASDILKITRAELAAEEARRPPLDLDTRDEGEEQ